MSLIVIGVDPGLTGALAWLLVHDNGGAQLLEVHDMPTATVQRGRSLKAEIQMPVLAQMLREGPGTGLGLPTAAYIENVHAMPGQGVTSMFRFGYATGAVAGVVAALDIGLSQIAPQEWQRIAQVRKDPDAGRLRATQLFPQSAALFGRKKDHNRADAALIAYAGAYQVTGKLPVSLVV